MAPYLSPISYQDDLLKRQYSYMPIHCLIKPQMMSRDEYHQLDHMVMRIIFDIHNDLGSLYDEKIYQKAIISRCLEAGLETKAEVPIQISYQEFVKQYKIDLIIDSRVIYELKTSISINANHRRQTLNYLFLTGFNYGKLVNMRPSSVESEFITTSLTPHDRKQFTIDKDGWKDMNKDSVWLREIMISLLSDWGVFLNIPLYCEAISFFRGGEQVFTAEVEIINNGSVLGTQKVNVLNPETAVHISAIKKSIESYQEHLHRFLKNTSLKAIQWINLNHHQVLMKTIQT